LSVFTEAKETYDLQMEGLAVGQESKGAKRKIQLAKTPRPQFDVS